MARRTRVTHCCPNVLQQSSLDDRNILYELILLDKTVTSDKIALVLGVLCIRTPTLSGSLKANKGRIGFGWVEGNLTGEQPLGG